MWKLFSEWTEELFSHTTATLTSTAFRIHFKLLSLHSKVPIIEHTQPAQSFAWMFLTDNPPGFCQENFMSSPKPQIFLTLSLTSHFCKTSQTVLLILIIPCYELSLYLLVMSLTFSINVLQFYLLYMDISCIPTRFDVSRYTFFNMYCSAIGKTCLTLLNEWKNEYIF